jgi:hypothetical protein
LKPKKTLSHNSKFKAHHQKKTPQKPPSPLSVCGHIILEFMNANQVSPELDCFLCFLAASCNSV